MLICIIRAHLFLLLYYCGFFWAVCVSFSSQSQAVLNDGAVCLKWGSNIITEWLTLEGTLEVILSNSPAQAGSPKAAGTGPCSDSSWVFPSTSIIIEGISRFTKETFKQKTNPKQSTFHVQGITWVIAVNYCKFLLLENFKYYSFIY